MAGIAQWIKKTVETLVDPDKDERVQKLVVALHNGLRARRQDFSVAATVQGLEYSAKELTAAKEEVYRIIVGRGWRDGSLNAEEREVARWAAERLEIPPARAQAINEEFARQHFAVALGQAMEDGILDSREEARLQEIAASVGLSLPDFARRFFQSEGESFLRGIFLACIADGHLSEGEWNYLLSMTRKLGIAQDEMLQAIQPQAQSFVEHVLADAKADGRLSPHEEATLAWLVRNLGLPQGYCDYIELEVHVLRVLTEIEDGRLPSLQAPRGVEIRAGEIVHLHAPCTWRDVRILRSGTRCDDHIGTLTLTDNRLIFSSATKSQSIGFHKVVAHRGGSNWIEIQTEGKPASTFFFHDQSPIPYAVFAAAVAMANQTRVARAQSLPSGHIPRDVRQRVWQRYGGRCAECGATDYLEFDHIIPRAKGGSNSDSNVQLLCRRCNLKKTDRI